MLKDARRCPFNWLKQCHYQWHLKGKNVVSQKWPWSQTFAGSEREEFFSVALMGHCERSDVVPPAFQPEADAPLAQGGLLAMTIKIVVHLMG